MSLNEEERYTLVALEYEKAQAIFSQIEGLRSLGYWDNIANRLYYALFHAVSALLIHDKPLRLKDLKRAFTSLEEEE